MTELSLPKTIISSPNQEERNEDPPTAVKSTRHFEIVRTNAEGGLQEIHQTRIKSLRKELDYLKETNWKFESIDKYIG